MSETRWLGARGATVVKKLKLIRLDEKSCYQWKELKGRTNAVADSCNLCGELYV